MQHPIRNRLQSQGFDLNARAKIYTGVAIGALLPLATCRYAFDVTRNISDDSEILAWIAAVGLSIVPSSIGALYGGIMGAILPYVNKMAKKMKTERQKQSQLENTAQGR